MKNLAVTTEQKWLLQSKTYSLRPLSQPGHLNFFQAFQLSWLPSLTFVFSLLCLVCTQRFLHERLVLTIRIIGLVLFLAVPVAAVLVFLAGVVLTRIRYGVKWPAVLYWGYWPVVRLAMCVMVVVASASLGNHVWERYLAPYQYLSRLQAYQNILDTTPGTRLQDSGVVSFAAGVGVDRARTGCMKTGTTYCIAPIVMGSDLANNTSTGTNLFMAGTDCCNCPGEFRCGAWNQPGATMGGLRVMHKIDESFYKLAVQDWAATYKKQVTLPIFFEWVPDGVGSWQDMRSRGIQLLMLALIGVPFCLMILAYLANGILKFLIEREYAEPLEPPMLPKGYGESVSQALLPHMASRLRMGEAIPDEINRGEYASM